MKHKKPDIHKRPWTPFERIDLDRSDGIPGTPPAADYRNSRYHVGAWLEGGPDHPLGEYVHLSIKDHDRTARHDWRDLQRIKNELVGPEYEAIELYPAESRLVDSANQFHLFVFKTWRPPVGFPNRLVADGQTRRNLTGAVQRPFEQRPADCLTGEQFDALLDRTLSGDGNRGGQ